MSTIKLKICGNVKGHTKGSEVEIEVDVDGTPNDKFWRRRLKDAKIDNCVEVIKSSNAKKEKN